MRLTRIFLSSLSLLLLLAACDNKAALTAEPIKQEVLMHHTYVLSTVNGTPYPADDRTPLIEFGEEFRVSGAVCNRFTGQGELKNNVLTIKQMASTKMLCVEDDLNKLENEFSALLINGAEISVKENVLTLKGKDLVLEFTLMDRVQ